MFYSEESLALLQRYSITAITALAEHVDADMLRMYTAPLFQIGDTITIRIPERFR